MIRIYVIFWMFSGFFVSAQEERDVRRVKLFHQLTLTRGWELGLWKVKNEVGDENRAKFFKLSMTAQAFRYWVLTQDGLIEPCLPYEGQIRKSFSNGDLDPMTLKNPLAQDANGNGGFGIEKSLDIEEYHKLAAEFEKHFLGEVGK